MLAVAASTVVAAGFALHTKPAARYPVPAQQRQGQGAALVTTSGAVAVAGLQAQIVGLEQALARRPTNASLRGQLLDKYLMRAQFLGQVSDFDRGAALLSTADARPQDLEQQSRLDSSVHLFSRAEALLDRAQRLDGVSRGRARETITLALGRDLPALLQTRQARADAYPSFSHLGDLANALAAVGRYDDADRAFERALRIYRDVSPFAVAWIAFQRGMMWSEMAGAPERGRAFYEEAVSRLPGYVHAQVHLAEIEFAAGERPAAVKRLRAIAAATEDPELLGRLAEFTQSVDPTGARALAETATLRYRELLTRHREAFLDHVAEFLMGAGHDPALALHMAKENLAMRQTDRAYKLVIEAALAAGARDAACQFSAEAGAGRPSVPLHRVQGAIAMECIGRVGPLPKPRITARTWGS